MEQVEAVVAMFVLVVIGGGSGGDGDSDVFNLMLCCCCCWVLLLLLSVCLRCRDTAGRTKLVFSKKFFLSDPDLDPKDLVLDDDVLLVDFIMYLVFIVIITMMKYL